jgi:2-polyprenyl-6-methoxyphenol hydroxylase-like FAD-dependent oxidoreductase
VRRLALLEPISTAAPLDVLWFMLPRTATDPDDAGALFRFGSRSLLVLMDHFDHWQIGFILPKGGYTDLKAQGIVAFQRRIAAIAPELTDRVVQITDWKQCSLLSVESSRLRRWYMPGLLLIGDAAHVMSPVGGVGINVAIQDAVAAANKLAAPLAVGHVADTVLAAIQRQRDWPTRIIQTAQAFAQQRVVARALESDAPLTFPWLFHTALRVPWLRAIPSWLIAFGVRAPKLRSQVQNRQSHPRLRSS